MHSLRAHTISDKTIHSLNRNVTQVDYVSRRAKLSSQAASVQGGRDRGREIRPGDYDEAEKERMGLQVQAYNALLRCISPAMRPSQGEKQITVHAHLPGKVNAGLSHL